MIVFAKSMDEATEIAYEMLKDKRAYKTIVDNYEIEDGDYDVEEIEF